MQPQAPVVITNARPRTLQHPGRTLACQSPDRVRRRPGERLAPSRKPAITLPAERVVPGRRVSFEGDSRARTREPEIGQKSFPDGIRAPLRTAAAIPRPPCSPPRIHYPNQKLANPSRPDAERIDPTTRLARCGE